MRAARGEIGRLRLGFTVIAFYGALPLTVRRFRDRYSEIAIDLFEMNSPAVEAALAAGEVDLGVLHPPLYTAGLDSRALRPQRMLLALPEGHRLADKPVVAVRDLEGEPLLIAPRSVDPSIADRMMALFRAEDITPTIAQEITPMTTLTGLISAGAGIGFVTEGIATVSRPGVIYRPVAPEPPTLPMAVAWRRGMLSHIADRFIEVITNDDRETG